jgi:type IV secretion system protein VirB6
MDMLNLGSMRAGVLDDLLSVTSFNFFPVVFEFLREEIRGFQERMLGHFIGLFFMLAISLLTIWIFFQGWRVLSGRMREPAMAVVGDGLKALLILGIATSWAAKSGTIYDSLTTGLESAIYGIVTDDLLHGNSGDKGDSIYEGIAENLEITTLALNAMNDVSSAQTGGNSMVEQDSMLLETMVMLGSSGPALTGGAMVLLYQIAMALFTGLGPLFIVFLLFDATKSLFSRWLLYGIGTMFSLAVLYVLSGIAMKLMTAVGGVLWATNAIVSATNLENPSGLREAALQTSGLGLILTTMLITAPPMAASFFQGALGQFMWGNAFAGGASRPDANGRMAGQQGYMPAKSGVDSDSAKTLQGANNNRPNWSAPPQHEPGSKGAAAMKNQ